MSISIKIEAGQLVCLDLPDAHTTDWSLLGSTFPLAPEGTHLVPQGGYAPTPLFPDFVFPEGKHAVLLAQYKRGRLAKVVYPKLYLLLCWRNQHGRAIVRAPDQAGTKLDKFNHFLMGSDLTVIDPERRLYYPQLGISDTLDSSEGWCRKESRAVSKLLYICGHIDLAQLAWRATHNRSPMDRDVSLDEGARYQALLYSEYLRKEIDSLRLQVDDLKA
jgi:hypothetical protein